MKEKLKIRQFSLGVLQVNNRQSTAAYKARAEQRQNVKKELEVQVDNGEEPRSGLGTTRA